MIVLCDTNILLRSIETDHPRFLETNEGIEKLIHDKHELVILFQNIAEFWNVCTRPKDKNGFGFSIDRATGVLESILGYFDILIESPETVGLWRELVITHQVKGVQVHDARLVAAMKMRGIRHILTYNGRDFSRYPDLTILTPADVLTA